MRIFLFIFLFLLACLARAEELGAPEMRLSPGGGSYRSALALEAKVHFRISGMVAHVQLEQVFRNDSADWVDGEYLFPLPERSAVNHLRLEVGERVIVGEIKEKQEAKAVFEKARKAGRKAGLVEQRRPNLFSNRIANIAPGESVKVQLEYIQRVEYHDGQFSLRFPTTVTPRYWPQGFDASDVWQFQNPVAATSARPIQAIVVTAELDMGLPLEQISAPYHALTLTRQRELYSVALASGSVAMDRDFVLTWTPVSGREPRAAVFHEQVDGEDYALLMVLPPRGQEVEALPRELVFVIDTSGSMGGTSIHQARASLAFALQELGPEDSFNVIEFNNTARALFRQSQPADAHNLARAREFVRHLDAGGGTEMLSALQLALPAQRVEHTEPEKVRQVVFITDGAVGNEVQLFRAIEQRLQGDRLFTVGIGSAPNSWFMTKAAQLGRGQFVFIGDVLEVQGKMQALFSQLSQTLVADFAVDWPGSVEVYPDKIPDLYPGEPLLIAARSPQTLGDSMVTVSGRSAQQAWQRELVFPSVAKGKSGHSGVATLWAREKIASLLDEQILGRDKEAVRAEGLPVALQHQLISPWTSFVAVEKQISRPEEALMKKRSVANLRPKGQAPQTQAWPRTATPATLRLWLGALALLVALSQFGSAGWIHFKAELAQILIAHAWLQGAGSKPWPWADTWPVARLQMPGRNVDLYVLAGQQGNALAFGPGMSGDTVISGHRDTHFEFLQSLQAGEEFSLQRDDGSTRHYRITQTRVADTRHESLQVGQGVLALVTCYPFDAVLPGGPLRYVVEAEPVQGRLPQFARIDPDIARLAPP